MKSYNPQNLLKKALIITGITSTGLFLSFPALASLNSTSNLNQDSNNLLAQTTGNDSINRTDSIDINNVDTGDRNTAPQINREQNRPGTGSDSDTQQNLTDVDDGTINPNDPIMQNRMDSQNNPNNRNMQMQMQQNRPATQNYPNNTNTNPQGGTQMNQPGTQRNQGGTQMNQPGTQRNQGGTQMNQMNNRGANTVDGTEAGAIQGLW